MKRQIYAATAIVILLCACKKNETNTPSTTVTPNGTKTEKAIVLDYHDGTVDSVFQDSMTNRVIRISRNWSNTINLFSDITNGISIINQNGISIEGYDTVIYSSGLPNTLKSYDASHAPTIGGGVTQFKYYVGSNLLSVDEAGVSNYITYSYAGGRLTAKNISGAPFGDTVRYYYGNSPLINKLNTANSELKNAYIVSSFAVYRQITDVLFYSSHLPDSIVYSATGGQNIFHWKMTYDTLSNGIVHNVYTNGTKKITIAQ